VQIQEKKAMATYPETTFGASDAAKPESIVGDMKAQFGEFTEPLKDQAEQLAEDQKAAGSGHMKTLATAVHGAARELEDGMPKIASSVHSVAEQIERTAADLRNRNVEELFEGFDRYARQQPALVFGGALMAGFILSRFLKSSASPASLQPTGNGQT
jgi:hypothetical protein